jgi:hypothetical protein
MPDLPDHPELEDFWAILPDHKYVFMPTGVMWPAESINGRFGRVEGMKASQFLDINRHVDQITWIPGHPRIIEDHMFIDGEIVNTPDKHCYNLYRAPSLSRGNPALAVVWTQHVKKIYPDEADHIIKWCAHRVQFPGEKVNHALVLGGAMGIGKDALIEPVRRAIGVDNFQDIKPDDLFSGFNGFMKAVVIRISEAHDLGETNRYAFYDRSKTVICAPPDTNRINEKFINPYNIPNVAGVIITTNYRSNGLYIPEDDRRHFVAFSPVVRDAISRGYWGDLWGWYEQDGGYAHTAAYLATVDITDFDPKAPPPRTPAFWDMVASGRTPETDDMAEALDRLGRPVAVILADIANITTDASFREWLHDRANRRKIPHRMEENGYSVLRNPDSKQGLWRIGEVKQNVYTKNDLSYNEQMEGVRELIRKHRLY